MASHTKVLNISSGLRIKRSQAYRRIEQCVSEWVEDGVSIRDLTVAEMIAARSMQARAGQRREHERERLGVDLGHVELPGVVFRLGDNRAAVSREMALARDAQRFADQRSSAGMSAQGSA